MSKAVEDDRSAADPRRTIEEVDARELSMGPRDPVGAAVRSCIQVGVIEILGAGPAARDDGPEGVHQMRVAANRLRGELRAFRPILDKSWAAAIDDELRWLRGLLAEARELDVLRSGLEGASIDIHPALAPLFEAIDTRRAKARERLDAILGSDRFEAFRSRIKDAARSTVLVGSAMEPCREALPALVRRLWDRFRVDARRLGPDVPDDGLHDLRRRAKRVRYAAEAAARSLGPRASSAAGRFARRVRSVQDVLGRHQDAVVAREAVARFTAARPLDGPFQFAAGRLLERQEEAARAAREDLPDALERLDRPKVRRWLTP